MTQLHYYIKLISSLLCIHHTKFSQSQPQSCSGDIVTQHCVCYLTKTQCKSAITSYDRTDCIWHSSYGCISITHEPTLEPTAEPTLEPIIHTNPVTNEPTRDTTTTSLIAPTAYPTYSPISPTLPPTYTLISTLQCGSVVHGETDEIYHIHWYGLCIETTTDLFIDSCGSGYDTWLYFQHNNDVEMRIDCDDCGDCSVQTQLHIFKVNQGNYTVGVGGYRGHYGMYRLHIACSSQVNRPTIIPTSRPTQTPTSSPTNTPTSHPTHAPTMKPTQFPTDEPTNRPSNSPTYVPSVNTPNPTMDPTAKPTTEPTFDPTTFPTPVPTPRPTPKPSAKPTVSPTVFPTVNPTELPSVDPTEVTETRGTTYVDSTVTVAEINDMWVVKDGSNTMNRFEIALILALVMVSMVVGVMFALKYVNVRRIRHEKVDLNENGSADSDEDFLQYLHGKTNSINIDEILLRAKTSLINVTLDENNAAFVE